MCSFKTCMETVASQDLTWSNTSLKPALKFLQHTLSILFVEVNLLILQHWIGMH